ncbi:MAG: ribosomal-protein-alanine N-acetyltransferase [Gammaproteobacteria bacterium]|nr:ribosomal-protein-alanine N-acetyltransferase [Gammaproteobacteria bacterium]
MGCFQRLKIVPCSVEDIDILLELEKCSTKYGWSKSDIASSINAGYDCYKLIEDQRVSGYCVIQLIGEEMEILNIVIHRRYQGMGYGGFLLTSIFQMKRYESVKDVWLEVRESNVPARKLYGRIGFTQSGTRKNYYHRNLGNTSGQEDALVMTLRKKS